MRLNSSLMTEPTATTNSRPLNNLVFGCLLCGAVLMLFATATAAGQSTLQAQLVQFLQSKTAQINGQVAVEIDMPDTPLGACDAPQPFLPRRTSHLAGSITVGVKCPGNAPVTRYFRAYISITTTYFAASHLLQTGDTLTLDDLQQVRGDITRLPPGVVTNPGQLLGKVIVRRIPEGIPLTKNMVRIQHAVERGDHVKLKLVGSGFAITTSGTALNKAPLGGQVRVRTANGATVTGIIRQDHTVILHR